MHLNQYVIDCLTELRFYGELNITMSHFAGVSSQLFNMLLKKVNMYQLSKRYYKIK